MRLAPQVLGLPPPGCRKTTRAGDDPTLQSSSDPGSGGLFDGCAYRRNGGGRQAPQARRSDLFTDHGAL